MYTPKPLFEQRMNSLLKDEEDKKAFWQIIHIPPQNSIRCNTIKISPEILKNKLESKGWKISQPYPQYKEILLVESELSPGELGKSIEHILGEYYVQEISSMMSIIALNPSPGELVLDLCASPGSKTTYAVSLMKNTGIILANDKDNVRTAILSANLQRCGSTNSIITRHDAVILCKKLEKLGIKFDKILLDVPCSGEGTLRSSPKTLEMWNLNMIKKLSRIQKKIISSAVPLLKENGSLVYSTCTHSPEENEKNISFLIERFNMETEKISLPIKCRQGIAEWQGEIFKKGMENCHRIYPQDNNTEGFFLAKLKFRGEK
ncbi:RsmB/NOP family class I SAM-dependent RNA methyltransferase [Candidatus Pacearchaeota archaeon]|nr:RsmB/NOP family class I SAM-dependent RNA methyltransferase [Candidatus Pacearchaeota archaeon]